MLNDLATAFLVAFAAVTASELLSRIWELLLKSGYLGWRLAGSLNPSSRKSPWLLPLRPGASACRRPCYPAPCGL
jgi:hypothetical protein